MPATSGQRGWRFAATCVNLTPNSCTCTSRPISMMGRGLEGQIFCAWICAPRGVCGRILLCLRMQGYHGRTQIAGVAHPSLCPRGWRCTRPGLALMLLGVGLPVAARLKLESGGKMTRRLPQHLPPLARPWPCQGNSFVLPSISSALMHFRFSDCSMLASTSAIPQIFSSVLVPCKQLTWHLHLAMWKDQLQ